MLHTVTFPSNHILDYFEFSLITHMIKFWWQGWVSDGGGGNFSLCCHPGCL